jgi:hypothetical protein
LAGCRKVVGIAVAVVALTFAAPASATFPGQNGRLLFIPGGGDLYTMNADGTGAVRLTNDSESEFVPQLSPDGSKIAYYNGGVIRTVNADGTGKTSVTNDQTQHDSSPTWSPDGTQLAVFTKPDGVGPAGVAVMPIDGTSRTRIVSFSTLDPQFVDWSPTGRIAFTRNCGLYAVDPDGGNQTTIRQPPSGCIKRPPDWSPDGTRISFAESSSGGVLLKVADSDGSNLADLTPAGLLSADIPVWSPDGQFIAFTGPASGGGSATWITRADGAGAAEIGPATTYDWQHVVGPAADGYPRPKGATPLRVPLVPAFNRCIEPNSSHGSPLASPSCVPPRQASLYLTVGTPDANGQAAGSTGALVASTITGDPDFPGDQADVRFTIFLTDVRARFDETQDYVGELQADITLRITDRFSGPTADDPATVQNLPLVFTFQCLPTTATVGSGCGADTTADALIPGMTREGKRSIWETPQIRIFDGGEDGIVSTQADNTLFVREGLFVP